MNATERQTDLQRITRKLVIFTGVILIVLAGGLYWLSMSPEKQSFLVILVFVAGLLGGFVSIQQRLPAISFEEMKVISESWVSITLIPLNGGIFAVVLMLMFAGRIIQGQLFPTYPDTFSIQDADSFFLWLKNGYPLNGVDVAKLLFWSFVAGFSERFVPQVIRRTTEEVKPKSHQPDPVNRTGGSVSGVGNK